jgi:uncharacterized protein YeaO (DUF488 family)
MGTIRLKRAFDPPRDADGRRFLVDRIWPRGVRKDDLKLDRWLKDAAPSDDLRRWFGHAETRWPEFAHRYRAELEHKVPVLEPLLDALREGDITLVYAARDGQRNNAVVLKAFLEALHLL